MWLNKKGHIITFSKSKVMFCIPVHLARISVAIKAAKSRL